MGSLNDKQDKLHIPFEISNYIISISDFFCKSQSYLGLWIIKKEFSESLNVTWYQLLLSVFQDICCLYFFYRSHDISIIRMLSPKDILLNRDCFCLKAKNSNILVDLCFSLPNGEIYVTALQTNKHRHAIRFDCYLSKIDNCFISLWKNTKKCFWPYIF